MQRNISVENSESSESQESQGDDFLIEGLEKLYSEMLSLKELCQQLFKLLQAQVIQSTAHSHTTSYHPYNKA